jgi:hypothetical protein
MRSPIYWHPYVYHFVIRILYGKNFSNRYRALAEFIPDNSRVVELCMGDAYLYTKYLRKKNVHYLGLDINPIFVRLAIKKNIPAKVHNILNDEIPPAEIILMQGSLYQFIPEERKVISKMLCSATKKVLISEPVHNRAHSKNPIIRILSRYGVNPGTGNKTERFDKELLLRCFSSFSELTTIVNTGKEIIGVFEK